MSGTANSAGSHTHTATLNGDVVGKSTTVQPQTIKGFMYIVVANKAKTEIEVDIDNVVTDLNNQSARITTLENTTLNRTQITNCILEAPGGGIAYTETTVTAKAGLRYLTGNGRNADYTLKTAEHTLQNDVSVTFNGFGANTQGIAYIFNGALMYCPINEVYHVDNSPTVEAPVANAGTNQLWFEKWNNVVYHSIYGSTEWVLTTDCVIIGTFYPNSSGKITGIRRNRPVDILKRSDKNEVAGWGFPSSTYIDLTLSGTGTAYTAPADGYVVFGKQSTAIDQHVLLVQSGAVWQICWATAVGANLFVSMPVKKGRIFNASYTTLGPTQVFRFYYAEGAKP